MSVKKCKKTDLLLFCELLGQVEAKSNKCLTNVEAIARLWSPVDEFSLLIFCLNLVRSSKIMVFFDNVVRFGCGINSCFCGSKKAKHAACYLRYPVSRAEPKCPINWLITASRSRGPQ